MLFALLAACASSPPGPPPPEETEPSPELVEHMQGHLTAVRRVRDGLRRGDLAAAKAANEAFLEHDVAFDLPGDWVPHVTAMGSAAKAVDQAPDLHTAATHAAEMVEACVGCHEAVQAEVELPRGAVAVPAR